MKKSLSFLIIILISSALLISQPAFGFEWLEKGFTVKSQEATEAGTRLFLEDQTQRSFVLVAEESLLTNPVKEKVLALFTQINDTYNFATTQIEFKIKPGILTTTLQLAETEQVFTITHHGLTPPESMIPTSSVILNEFASWKNFKGKQFQLVFEPKTFTIVVVPETETPLIKITNQQGQPSKKLVSNLAPIFNNISTWKNLALNTLSFDLNEKALKVEISTDEENRSVKVNYRGGIPVQKSINRVSRFYDIVAGWESIRTNQLLFVAQKERVDAVIAPSSFTSKGKDLLKHLPAGMTFKFEKKLSYNFRIVSKNYFVRLRDTYSTENKLIFQINEAIKDPILYIQIHDPEYFYRQIEGLRTRHAEVYDELKDSIGASYAELQEKHLKLQSSYDNLRVAHEKLIYGVINLENEGLLSSAAVDKSIIEKIIEYKSEDPGLSYKQVREKLEQDKLDASGKVVHLILSLYFNDFAK